MQAYQLTDFEWGVIAPLCRTSRAECRGWMIGGCSTEFSGCCGRARRGALCRRKAGVWDRVMAAVSQAFDGDVQMIDSTSVRVHQHAANSKKM